MPVPTGTVVLDANLRGTVQFVSTVPRVTFTNDDGDPEIQSLPPVTVVLDTDDETEIDLADTTVGVPSPREWIVRFFTAGSRIPDSRISVVAGTRVPLADAVSTVVGPAVLPVFTDTDRRLAEAAAATALAAALRAEAAAEAAVGGPGGGGYPFENLSTWSTTHNLGRLPVVAIYDEQGPVLIDYHATESTVTVTWPKPTSGTLVLK